VLGSQHIGNLLVDISDKELKRLFTILKIMRVANTWKSISDEACDEVPTALDLCLLKMKTRIKERFEVIRRLVELTLI